jgi:curved DNA-binding protein CbpA
MDYRKDYYQILEVSLAASKEEIRAAYRRLAKLYHPDRNAGNAEAEEKFKLINEANEILSNDILKHEYDAYRAEQERWEKNQAEQETGKDEIKQSNKKSYTKTKTVVTETRIYIRGEIIVKYWADCEERLAASYNTVLDYKIKPTEAVIAISEQNIFPVQGIPLDYLRAFKESDIFTMPIPQPIRCEVAGESGKEYFELTLKDIRIKSIRLEGVTKHENNSYGTLIGQFYGYSPKLTYEEVEETVTECFGETGKVEQKEEAGFNFVRKEYYHTDCSTYWGNWIQLPKAGGYEPRRRSSQSFSKNYSYSDPGCGLFAWGITLLAILFISPKFFIFCLLLIVLGLLLYHSEVIFSSVGRLLSFVGAGLFLLFLITAVRSIFNPDNGNYIKKKETPGSVKTTRTIRQSSPANDSTTTSSDTLITHFLKWEDYAGKSYEGNISISVTALRIANEMHEQMSRSFYQDMNDIYKTMLDHDSSQLLYIYETFDSIKAANDLGEVAFSQMLVSAIQSQPYYLVLDKGCDENYSDDFTWNYLANCKTDCCIGNELFGVRSPVEFLSDLKGDCDTRSLLLYQLFKHYNYNVALLTSSYYKHAMIAINFTEPVSQPGTGITIGEKIYYMWETTSPDLNYGEVSSNFNNLAFWDISLLNKKIDL